MKYEIWNWLLHVRERFWYFLIGKSAHVDLDQSNELTNTKVWVMCRDKNNDQVCESIHVDCPERGFCEYACEGKDACKSDKFHCRDGQGATCNYNCVDNDSSCKVSVCFKNWLLHIFVSLLSEI